MSALSILSSIAMVMVTMVAIVGNVWVIGVILTNSSLRGHLTYVFVLNLCITDVLCAIIVLPVAMATYLADDWLFGIVFCRLIGFISSLFTFASILSVCLISAERFYSIRIPMHYAVNMTLRRALAAVWGVWLLALLFSLLPLIGWNNYGYQAQKVHCSFTWRTEGVHRGYVIVAGTFCFLVPTLIMLVMYIGIYRVAKKSASQVVPMSLMPPRDMVRGFSPNAMEITDTQSTGNVLGYDEDDIGQIDVTTEDSGVSVRTPNSSSDVLGGVTNRRKTLAHWKAIRTLLFITTLFLVLWGPYFVTNFYGAANGYLKYSPTLEILTVWLGFSSFALNPLVYGLLNRKVRGAIMLSFQLIRNKMCGDKARTRVVEEEIPQNLSPQQEAQPQAEDIYEFLRGTNESPKIEVTPTSNMYEEETDKSCTYMRPYNSDI